MKKNRLILWFWIGLLMSSMLLSACHSNNKRFRGQPKKGKAIPCPIKDC